MLSQNLAPVLSLEFKRKERDRVWLTEYRQDGAQGNVRKAGGRIWRAGEGISRYQLLS